MNPSDESPTLAELETAVAQFIRARDWEQFHTPRNLAVSITIEAAELLEHFQWLTAEQSAARLKEQGVRNEVASELADILIYALSFARAVGIDPAAAIRAKLERNEQRFPVETVRGRLGTRPGGGHSESGIADDESE